MRAIRDMCNYCGVWIHRPIAWQVYLMLLIWLLDCLAEICFNEVSLWKQNFCTEHKLFCRQATYANHSHLNLCSIFPDLITTLPVRPHILSFTELQYFTIGNSSYKLTLKALIRYLGLTNVWFYKDYSFDITVTAFLNVVFQNLPIKTSLYNKKYYQYQITELLFSHTVRYRHRFPGGMRRSSEAAWLLGSRVHISLRAWVLVSCVLCVMLTIRSLIQIVLSGVCVCVCVCNSSCVI